MHNRKVIISVVYTIFGNAREVLVEHGCSQVLAQNYHVAFGEERYRIKESELGRTMI